MTIATASKNPILGALVEMVSSVLYKNKL